jgi:hypothetical protein
MPYITVTNAPNQISTVHRSDCAHLGNYGSVTASSERLSFEDGLAAIAHARAMMPKRFLLAVTASGSLLEY